MDNFNIHKFFKSEYLHEDKMSSDREIEIIKKMNPDADEKSLKKIAKLGKDKVKEIIKTTVKEYTSEDEIASRIRKLGKENGIANADIKKYVDELSGSFEPDAYKNTTDAELLDDLKLYMDLAEGN